jgi:regulatory protein
MPRSAAAAAAPTAYQRALRRLARRDHSEQELRRALAARGHEPEEVEAALRRLRSERYLDDAGFAERFARSRLANAGLGRARIRQGLRQRGVARPAAEAGLAAALREVREPEVLDRLARRYWRHHTAVEPERRLLRLFGFLLRRGFPPGMVRERLAALWPRRRHALEALDPLEVDVSDDPRHEGP